MFVLFLPRDAKKLEAFAVERWTVGYSLKFSKVVSFAPLSFMIQIVKTLFGWFVWMAIREENWENLLLCSKVIEHTKWQCVCCAGVPNSREWKGGFRSVSNVTTQGWSPSAGRLVRKFLLYVVGRFVYMTHRISAVQTVRHVLAEVTTHFLGLVQVLLLTENKCAY